MASGGSHPSGGPSAILATRRWYRPDTLVLETEFDTATGTVRITDCMPIRDDHPHLVRSVEGVSGTVDMHMELVVRFDYGEVVPWVTSTRRPDPPDRRPRFGGAVAPGRRGGQGPAHRGRLHRHREAALSLHLGVAPLARGAATPARQLLRRAPDRGLLDRVGDAVLLRGAVSRTRSCARSSRSRP